MKSFSIKSNNKTKVKPHPIPPVETLETLETLETPKKPEKPEIQRENYIKQTVTEDHL